MKRVLVILSLMLVSTSLVFAGSSGETVVTGGTGIRLTEFGEAPELTARVTAGELPPVEQRIPSQPLVIVRNEIRTCGGTLRTAHEGTATGLVLTVYKFMGEFLRTWDPDVTETGPNLLRKVDVSPDATQFTWHLREANEVE